VTSESLHLSSARFDSVALYYGHESTWWWCCSDKAVEVSSILTVSTILT
jgi:hypothetical protein